jgi:SAM-dependent methyltransferase/uncharacterized protein YbaR (Trm112 family)
LPESFESILRCPECHKGSLKFSEQVKLLTCKKCKQKWPVVHGRPVLLRHDNDLFSITDYLKAPQPGSSNQTQSGISAILPGISVNLSSARILKNLSEKMRNLKNCRILVVGGGRQRIWLDKILDKSNTMETIYSDIDINSDVDLFCDGHDLPFPDNSFDAVITTAVLEHVLYPEQVASEIQRVLKMGGYLYSELPFMQQVHEGAYDFTRYTLSGHRRLFNGIKELEAGMVAGPATALVWAIENFYLSFASGKIMRKIIKLTVRLLFFWIKYFDYILANKPQAMDGASCTFLYGTKAQKKVSDIEIIRKYTGRKNITHT